MCRMLAYVGKDKEKLKKLAQCLILSAKDDPITHESHKDGWGIVAYNGGRVLYYRSVNPIFNESEVLFSLINLLDGEIKAIIHARLASDKNLVSSYLSHPYMESNEKSIIYFAHNGSVNKEELGKALNIDSKLMVDSELIGKYISLYGIEKVKELKVYTKSALNLLILKIDRENRDAHLYYYNYYNVDYVRKKGTPEEYYYLYKGDGYVFSSSLAYTGCEKGDKVKFGELEELKSS